MEIKVIEKGALFIINLKSNPTAGFVWELMDLPDSFELVFTQFLPDKELPGSGGNDKFVFKPMMRGIFHLRFVMKRKWEAEPISEEIFEIQVK